MRGSIRQAVHGVQMFKRQSVGACSLGWRSGVLSEVQSASAALIVPGAGDAGLYVRHRFEV